MPHWSGAAEADTTDADPQVKLRDLRIELDEIEETLRAHPTVRDAVVQPQQDTRSAGDGIDAGRLVAWVVCEPSAVETGDLSAEQIEQWAGVYDYTYSSDEPAVDGTFDTAGWNSSFTGEPLPAEEVRECVDQTVERILALHPRRVLELGCGNGLLLFRIAPHTQRYLGRDISQVGLERIRRELRHGHAYADRVELAHAAAHELSDLDPGTVDTVVLNSVVQLFIGTEYLTRVLVDAARLVAPGGRLFIGDVRNLMLLEAFHTAVALARAEDALPTRRLRTQVAQSASQESELVLDPLFFEGLREHLPRLGRVEIQVKRLAYDNEISRYRYDVVLHLDEPPGPSGPVEWLDWAATAPGLDGLAARLTGERPAALGLTGVPDARLAADTAALALLNGAEPPATAGDLRRAVATVSTADGVDSEALWALGERLGYEVEIRPSTARPGSYDVLFHRAGDSHRNYRFPGTAGRRPLDGYANQPLHQRIRQRFTPVWRSHLKEKLPGYPVPSLFVPVDEIPQRANGELDRAVLASAPLPVPDADGSSGAPAPSGRSLEESVREVWTEVLGVPDIDATTSFFDAGGDSLSAMQVVSRLHARHGTMSMRMFMSAPTIAGLAKALGDAAVPAPSAAAPAPSALSPTGSETVGRYPLSRAQRQMWDIANRLPDIGFFIVASAVRVDGPLDLTVLERTFAELVNRHEALRTRFEDTGDGPVQVVEPHVTVTIEVEDHTAAEDPIRSCEKRMAVAGREALPLDRAPLMRVVVHRIAADRHVMFLSVHHIVCDGQSLTLLQDDLTRIYREIVAGGAPVPRPVPLGSGTLAKEWAEWLTTGEAARQREFWLDRLAPPFPKLADGPGSRFTELGTASFVQRMRSATASAKLSADDMRAVSAAARKHGMTDFMLVLGAYAATLRAWSGLDDIRVATALANRVGSGMDEVVGLLANTIVLRMRLRDTDPVAVSRQVREVCIDAFDNQKLPFEEVLAELHHRHPDAGAIFDAMLVGLNEIATVTPDDGLVFAPYESDHNVLGAGVVAPACSFVLTAVPLGGELRFELRYQTATTSKELAAELLDAITTAVRANAAALLAAP